MRNLMYRARKELQKFYPDNPELSFILSKGNTYAWNSEIPCEIDIVQMDELCKKIEEEEAPEASYQYCKSRSAIIWKTSCLNFIRRTGWSCRKPIMTTI